MERIAILCSGGDAQGMNTCIKTIVKICESHGVLPIAVNRGFQGLIENDFSFLNHEMVANIDNLGGCFIKVSRCDDFRTSEGIRRGVNNLIKNKIDGLIVVGGNGSFKGVEQLCKHGIKCIAIPATIDNDLFYTDNSLGFDTAVNNNVSAIENIRQTMLANNRALVVEVMGRDCGSIALSTAFAVSAHSVATKELRRTQKDIIKDVRQVTEFGIVSPVVVVSERQNFSVQDVADEIEKQLGIETRACVLGYIQRGGMPSMTDRTLAIKWGISSVEMLLSGRYGLALGIKNGNQIAIDIADANNTKQVFDIEMYNALRKLYNLK